VNKLDTKIHISVSTPFYQWITPGL